MTISQIKVFLTAARCLNFSKAADQLDISQPTLSRQISGIESELNLLLFIRDGRKLRLTPAGKELAERFEVVYGNYQSAVTSARQIQKGIGGDLRIGVLHGTNVSDFMPPICQYFQKNYPNVEMIFTYGSFLTLQNKLYNNELDIILTVQFNVRDKDYILYKYVEHTHDYIIMNKLHPLAKKKNVTLEDCKDETFILISTEDCPESSHLIVQECIKRGFYPQISYAQNLYDLMLNTAVGRGITILDTRNMLRMDPYLVSVPLLGMSWDPSLVAAWNQDNYNPSIPIFMSQLDQFSRKREKNDT